MELLNAYKEIAFQNSENAKRSAELVIANKEVEQFAFVASHDLQEPLLRVSNCVQVFEEDYTKVLDDKAIQYLHEISNATNRMHLMIKSLLDFSKLGHKCKLSLVDCNLIIDKVVAELKPLIEDSEVVIEVAEMPKLNVYKDLMIQMFNNLITNAIKFRKKDIQPKIQIVSKKMKNHWRFSVEDNGIGMESVYYERVFNIFQRLHSNEDEYEGSGIGLANCKKIAELHHGKIWIESELGKGTKIYFTIPEQLS